MKKIKDSKLLSSLAILLVYVTGSILGIILFKVFNYPLALNLLLVDVIITFYVFLFSLIFNNASVYDPYWSVLPVVVIGAFFISNEFNIVSFLIFLSVLIWGIRLTLNWLYTFPNLHKQDWRYQMLKEKSKKLYVFVNFLGIHLFPTLVVYLCILPAVLTINTNPSFSILNVLGFVLCLIAIMLELIADVTMHRFRKQKTGGLIRVGIWKYSRHPNYLGEILMWFGILLQSISAVESNIFLIIGPIVNLLMFLFISIPMAEKRQSLKHGFSEYKKQTRMLLPIPRFNKKMEEINDQN